MEKHNILWVASASINCADLLGAGDQFLDAQLSGSGAEGEAHDLGDVEDRKTIGGLIFFFNLMLPSIEICLAEGTGDGDGVRPCFLRFVEEVVCKF